MKKILLLSSAGLFLAVLFFLFRPARWGNVPDQPSRNEERLTTHESVPRPTTPTAPKPSLSPRSVFLDGETMNAVRVALGREDHAGLDNAFKDLIAFITTHPELVDDYVAVMKSEKDEHVLRTFALALAATEVGLLQNDKIVSTAIELAKDPSFEQRQHIMLNLMTKFPELRDDVFQTVLEVAQRDPQSQVRTSAVAALADWLVSFPQKSDLLIDQLTRIFKNNIGEDVRIFSYQLFALHKEQLPRELLALLSERLDTEPDIYSRNLIVSALTAAPTDIQSKALAEIRATYGAESDLEKRRNLLAQIVCLSKNEVATLLQKVSMEDSLLADDARGYLELLANGVTTSDAIFAQKAASDAQLNTAASDEHKSEKN